MKITVGLVTARGEYPCKEDPDWHNVGGLADCLAAQTTLPRELIVVPVTDRESFQRWTDANARRYPFEILVVPPVPNPWHARGKAAISTTRNAVIANADAGSDLILWVGDGWSLSTNILERVRFWYETHGAFLDPVHRGWAHPNAVIDDRERVMVAQGIDHLFDVDAYGGCLDRKAIEVLQGYETLMDTAWGCEDGEMSMRMRLAGFRTVVERDVVAITRATREYHCFKGRVSTLCPVALMQIKHRRVVNEKDFRIGRGLTDAERATLVPQCVYLGDGDVCTAYPGNPPCSQPSRRPDLADEDTRIALGL